MLMEWLTQPQFFIKAFGLFFGIAWIIALHRGNKTPFSLADLFLEDGKLSARKFYESGAYFVTTLWILMLVLMDKAGLTEVMAYAGLWVLARTGGQLVQKNA